MPPIPLDVNNAGQWPHQSFDAVFTANTCHIMPEMALPQLLAGAARVLQPLAYGAMSANNLTLIFQLEDSPVRQQIAARAGDQNMSQFKPC